MCFFLKNQCYDPLFAETSSMWFDLQNRNAHWSYSTFESSVGASLRKKKDLDPLSYIHECTFSLFGRAPRYKYDTIKRMDNWSEGCMEICLAHIWSEFLWMGCEWNRDQITVSCSWHKLKGHICLTCCSSSWDSWFGKDWQPKTRKNTFWK
jgi:hypothetical protein